MGTSPAGTPPAAGPLADKNVGGVPSVLYAQGPEALKAVRDDYLYWTGKLTETSVQLSYAVLGANWAVFGSVDGILAHFWSKVSVFLIVLSLALSVLGAKVMGEKHLERINYAEADTERWNAEFTATASKQDPWPFTPAIESLGRWMRRGKTWLPLTAGAAFLLALLI